MPERPYDNRDIRRIARRVWKEHWIAALIIPAILSLIPTLIGGIVSKTVSPAYVKLITIIVLLPVSPLVDFAVLQFSLDLWWEERVGIKSMFRNFRRFPAIWGIHTFTVFVPALAYAAGMVAIEMLKYIPYALYWIVGIPIAIAVLIGVFYVEYRLRFCSLYLAVNPDETAIDCIRYGWHLAKGFVLDIFGNELLLSIPFLIPSLLAEHVFADNSLVYFLLDKLPAIVFCGFVWLNRIAVNHYLMTGELNPPDESQQPSEAEQGNSEN